MMRPQAASMREVAAQQVSAELGDRLSSHRASRLFPVDTRQAAVGGCLEVRNRS